MNEFLPSRYVESVARLALGIECQDALRRGRIGWPIEVTLDGTPRPLPAARRSPGESPWSEPTVLRVIGRKDSCRHLLIVERGVRDPVVIRILDATQRFAPRRLAIRLPDPVTLGRQVRPVLHAGAAYPVPAGAVGIRGRVLRDGEPMRWARVEAHRTTDDVLIGRGAGDEHGEFVLLLDPEASRGADLVLPLTVRVTVFGPDTQPDPDDFPEPEIDPLWDLPVEEAAITPAGEAVLAGESLPAGYVSRPGSIREVDFSWHGLVREQFDFS